MNKILHTQNSEIDAKLAEGKLYPMLFAPNFHKKIWGGEQLRKWKQIEGDLLADEPIGESWEVSAVDTAPSIVANGVWAGKSLPEVISMMPNEILGEEVARKYNNQLPLLVKYIDAQNNLSIQVHPDNELAWQLHKMLGKSEMWYILHAETGSKIYVGFKDKLTREQYMQQVADGSIVDSLAQYDVNTGDVFYIPAGRIHAIGKGVVLAEVQQSCDLTYRIFDYNRVDTNGKPRELHTEYALQALDFNVYDDYRTLYLRRIDTANRCVDTQYFSARVVEVKRDFHRKLYKYGSFIISMCTEGDCVIRIRSTKDEILLREGYSCLIPAAIAEYDIIPVNGMSRLLESYINIR